MKIHDCTALITGANRGLGAALARALVTAGAKKVYAGARDISKVSVAGVVPVALDVTSHADVAAAAASCGDVNIVFNNAGVSVGADILSAKAADDLRSMLEINVFGMLDVAQAFAPVLKANGGGALVDVLSVLSWITIPGAGAYSATKSAAWSITNALRHALRAQGTRVVGVHVGFMDTDMTERIDAPKISPDEVARTILSAVESGDDEVLADEQSRQVKSGLSAVPGSYFAA